MFLVSQAATSAGVDERGDSSRAWENEFQCGLQADRPDESGRSASKPERDRLFEACMAARGYREKLVYGVRRDALWHDSSTLRTHAGRIRFEAGYRLWAMVCLGGRRPAPERTGIGSISMKLHHPVEEFAHVRRLLVEE